MDTAVEQQTAQTSQSSEAGLTSPASGAPAAASPTSSSPAPAGPGERPAYVPEAFWDAEKGLKADEFQAHLDTLQADAEQTRARAADIPEKVDGYELALPEGVELPKGIELNPNDPRLAVAREFALENKMTKAEFQRLVALDVRFKQAETAEFNAQAQAAMERLGPNAAARVEAVKSAIEAAVGNELAPHLNAMLVSDKQIMAFEQWLKSGTQFNAGGRAGGSEPGKVAGFEKMGFRERMAAADAAKMAAAR